MFYIKRIVLAILEGPRVKWQFEKLILFCTCALPRLSTLVRQKFWTGPGRQARHFVVNYWRDRPECLIFQNWDSLWNLRTPHTYLVRSYLSQVKHEFKYLKIFWKYSQSVRPGEHFVLMWSSTEWLQMVSWLTEIQSFALLIVFTSHSNKLPLYDNSRLLHDCTLSVSIPISTERRKIRRSWNQRSRQ